MLTHSRMMQRTDLQKHLDKTATAQLQRLLNSDRHFTRLALAHADAAIAVTNHGQRSKAHGATTLHHLADAVHTDHLFAEAVVFFLGGMPTLCFSHLTIPRLEFQTGFTRG